MNYPCTGINTYHPMEVGALSGTSASYSDEGLAGAGEGYGGEIGAVPENSWYPSWSEETAWGAERLTTPNVQEDVDLHTWFCHGAPHETWGNTWSARQPNDHLEWYEGTPWTPTTTTTTLPSSSHFHLVHQTLSPWLHRLLSQPRLLNLSQKKQNTTSGSEKFLMKCTLQ